MSMEEKVALENLPVVSPVDYHQPRSYKSATPVHSEVHPANDKALGNMPSPVDYHQSGSFKTSTPGHSEPSSAHNSPTPTYHQGSPSMPQELPEVKHSPHFVTVEGTQMEEEARPQVMYQPGQQEQQLVAGGLSEGYLRIMSQDPYHDQEYSQHIKYERDEGKTLSTF